MLFDPNSVVQAYLAGLRIRQQRELLEQQQAIAQARLLQQESQFQQNQQRLIEQNRALQQYREALIKLQGTGVDLNLLRAAGEGLIQGTPVAPGVQEIQGVTGPLRAPTPEALGQVQATRQKPLEELRTGERIRQTVESFRQTLPLRQAQAGFESDLRLQEANRAFERSLQQDAIQFEYRKQLAALNHSLRLREAAFKDNLEKTASIEERNQLLDVIAKDFQTGRLTLESMAGLGLKPEDRLAIMDRLQKAGAAPLSKKQIEQLEIVSKASDLYRRVERIVEQVETGDLNKIEKARQEMSGIRAQLGLLAKTVGGQTGAISDFENRLQEVNLPDTYFQEIKKLLSRVPGVPDTLKESNKTRLRNLREMVFGMKRAVLGPVRPAQLFLLDNTFGLVSDFQEVK